MSADITKEFARFGWKASLADTKLLQAAWNLAAGNYDVDLGGGVFKQRVAQEGGGSLGGFRPIILFGDGTRASSLTGSPRARSQ